MRLFRQPGPSKGPRSIRKRIVMITVRALRPGRRLLTVACRELFYDPIRQHILIATLTTLVTPLWRVGCRP